MSLDVTLYGELKTVKCVCSDCDHKHTRQERECLFEANITHNLNKMAERAGIYKEVWRPEEVNITKAYQLIKTLEFGIKRMEERPDFYKELSAGNGWGTYEDFLPWLERYLSACRNYPNSEIEVSR